MRLILLILVMSVSAFSAYVTNTASGRFRDSCRVDSLRNSFAIETDANGKFQRKTASDFAGRIPHGVTPGTLPKAATDSTFTNSHISENSDTVQVFRSTGGIDTAFDNFNRATLGANWTTITGFSTIDIQGDTAAHKSAAGWCGAYYNAVDSASYQSVTATLWYNTYTFIALRWQQSTATGYAVGWGGAINSVTVYEFTNGSYVELGTGFPAADGSIITFVAHYDSLIFSINGTPTDTIIDSSIHGGWPALVGWRSTAPTYGLWDNWSYSGGIDSLFLVNGRASIKNTPTTNTPAFLIAKNADPDNILRAVPISILDAPPHNVTPGQIPMSNGATTFRNTGTTVDSTTGDIHFYGKLIVGDTAYPGVTASIEAHGNSSDVDKDSLVFNISAAPLGQASRGSAFRVAGNENTALHGNAVMEAGDSGEALIGGKSILFHVDDSADGNSFVEDVKIGKDSVGLDDTNRVAMYGANRSINSAFRIYGGRGSSSTKSMVELGNKVSNRVNINGDTVNAGGRLMTSIIEASLADINGRAIIDSTPPIPSPVLVMVKSPTGDTIGSFPADSLKIAVCGSIHHHDDTTTVSVPTGAGYTKLGIFPEVKNTKNVTADTASDQLILTRNGYYDCASRVSCYVGTAWVNIRPVLFLNETEQDQTHDETNFQTATSKQRIFCSGLIRVTNAPDTISLRVRHDNGGSVNLSVTYGNLKAVFVGY